MNNFKHSLKVHLNFRLQKNKEVEVEIRGIADPEHVSAVAIGRTGIVYSNSFLSSNSDTTSFTFTATPDMTPEATLFVYYHDASGEIIHDRVELKFDEQLPNDVSSTSTICFSLYKLI